ncbi:hypothetical protein BH20ACT6_BH20ACT6_03240 [soil metagenome]
MRRYDDPVAVRRGLVDGVEGPEQFVWRDRLWRVRAVVARWVETRPWWEHSVVRDLLGDQQVGDRQDGPGVTDLSATPVASVATLVAEQEVWRVNATLGRLGLVRPDDPEVRGVFDLVLDGETGQWHLVGCLD